MSAKSLKTVRYGQHRREIACDADIQQRIHLQKVETKTVGFWTQRSVPFRRQPTAMSADRTYRSG